MLVFPNGSASSSAQTTGETDDSYASASTVADKIVLMTGATFSVSMEARRAAIHERLTDTNLLSIPPVSENMVATFVLPTSNE
jgi:hypothetical protein